MQVFINFSISSGSLIWTNKNSIFSLSMILRASL
nr:MAG TPA: hypothetical protein [Bacteriophage sp.]